MINIRWLLRYLIERKHNMRLYAFDMNVEHFVLLSYKPTYYRTYRTLILGKHDKY